MTERDNRFQLTRRKTLAALGSVGAASAGAGLGTTALFSDSETFENNTLTAGTLDLKIDWQQLYTGADGTVPVNAYPDHDDDGLQSTDAETEYSIDPRVPITLTCEDLDSGAELPEDVYDAENRLIEGTAVPVTQDSLIALEDVKPGDTGEVTFSVHVCDNPGYLWMQGALRADDENSVTEPEAKSEADPNDIHQPNADIDGDGELAETLEVTMWLDSDCDNTVDEGEDYIFFTGTLRQAMDQLSNNYGIPLDADPTPLGDPRDCFAGNTQHCIGFKWEVPTDYRNEIQSDSVAFDLGFYGEQCRNNDGSGIPVDDSLDALDTWAFDAPDHKVDLVKGSEDDDNSPPIPSGVQIHLQNTLAKPITITDVGITPVNDDIGLLSDRVNRTNYDNDVYQYEADLYIDVAGDESHDDVSAAWLDDGPDIFSLPATVDLSEDGWAPQARSEAIIPAKGEALVTLWKFWDTSGESEVGADMSEEQLDVAFTYTGSDPETQTLHVYPAGRVKEPIEDFDSV